MATYIPSNLLNSNYTYYLTNNDYITIRTNNNCYTNYNTTYCDCIDLFPSLDYIYSNTYSCSASSYNHTLNYNNLTSDYWYRIDIDKVLIIFLVIFIFGVYMPYKIISRLFGRWLKI